MAEIEFRLSDGLQLTAPEAEAIERTALSNGADIVSVVADGADGLAVTFLRRAPKFERIRRITGYLTGTLDTWNDAKRAEERDRVKHGAGLMEGGAE